MQKTGRNDPCPCGSGNKFKQCCQKNGGATPKAQPAAASQALQRAISHHRAGHLLEAEVDYRQFLQSSPHHPEVLYNLGLISQATGRLDDAIALFRRVLALKPAFLQVHVSLGVALKNRGLPEEAAACYRRALALRPDNETALFNLGNLLSDQGIPDDAAACYEKILANRPDFIDAYNNLGALRNIQGRFSEAISCFRKALSLKPDFAEAEGNLGNSFSGLGRFDEAVACYRRTLQLKPDSFPAYSALLFCLQYQPSVMNSELFAEAREFGRRVEEPLASRIGGTAPARSREKRIKVGFVSGDLRNHPVGYFLEAVMRHLDRDSFSYTAYANQPLCDGLSERIRPCFDAWIPVLNLTDDQLASRIRDDGITILVDLSGHTKNNRLEVFARKPAPVQVTWLGYANTTGLQTIDYILADPVTLPPAEEPFYTEKVWRLPETYLCFTPPDATVALSPPPVTANGYVTFGCFHNPKKVNDRVIACWAGVLRAVPRSLLLFKQMLFDDPTERESLCRRFERFGIPPERLRFEGRSSRDDYLAAYGRIDCALDPFPFPGATTTCEALWMGVPTLTLRLPRGMYGHNGELIMKSVRLADWVAESEHDYVARVVRLTSDIEGLQELRLTLRRTLLESPLCDAPRFAANLEDAFRGMVRENREGNI